MVTSIAITNRNVTSAASKAITRRTTSPDFADRSRYLGPKTVCISEASVRRIDRCVTDYSGYIHSRKEVPDSFAGFSVDYYA